jgi:hypothetical protein
VYLTFNLPVLHTYFLFYLQVAWVAMLLSYG